MHPLSSTCSVQAPLPLGPEAAFKAESGMGPGPYSVSTISPCLFLSQIAEASVQAAEDAQARKRSEATVSAAVALAAVVSGESPFIHVDSIQVCLWCLTV